MKTLYEVLMTNNKIKDNLSDDLGLVYLCQVYSDLVYYEDQIKASMIKNGKDELIVEIEMMSWERIQPSSALRSIVNYLVKKLEVNTWITGWWTDAVYGYDLLRGSDEITDETTLSDCLDRTRWM